MKKLLYALALLSVGPGAFSMEAGGIKPPAVIAQVPTALRDLLIYEAASLPANEAPGDDRQQLLQLLKKPRSTELKADKNFQRLRNLLPDAFASEQTAYAEAIADFLLDPGQSCRQPIVHRQLQQRYGAIAAEACMHPVPFLVLSRYGEAETVSIEPQRVRQIQLLFASSNRALASRFGHVSLRLVICPTASSSDEECALNISQHLVLGYRAHVDELALSLYKAVTGGYSAHFYANAFLDVYQEYAIDEFRAIEALPLQLDTARREAMVRELAELHFRASTPYRYMTSNCATLLQDSLRLLWPEFNTRTEASFLRPDRFFADMKALPISDAEALADAAAAERNGHLFPSTQPYYESAADVVRAAMSEPGFSDLQDFLQLNPVQRRQQRIADSAFAEKLQTDSHLREAQLLLEEYAMMRSERLLLAATAEYFAKQNIDALLEKTRRQMPPEDMALFDECLIKPIQSRSQPPLFPQGIPAETITGPAPKTASCQSEQAIRALRRALADAFKPDNRDVIRIRQLAEYHAQSIINVQQLSGATERL